MPPPSFPLASFLWPKAARCRTLPTAIYTYTQVPGGDANAARLAAVAVVLSLAALVVSEFLSRRITASIAG